MIWPRLILIEVPVAVRVDQLVLGGGDGGEHGLLADRPGVNILRLADVLHQRELVVCVVD